MPSTTTHCFAQSKRCSPSPTCWATQPLPRRCAARSTCRSPRTSAGHRCDGDREGRIHQRGPGSGSHILGLPAATDVTGRAGSYHQGIVSPVTTVTVRVPAKVNLQLAVGPVRADGYHDVATVYHAVSLFDEVSVAPAKHDSVVVAGEGADRVPT